MALPAHHPTSTSTSNSKTNPPDRIPTHLTRNPSNANPSPIRWGQLLWYTLDHTHTLITIYLLLKSSLLIQIRYPVELRGSKSWHLQWGCFKLGFLEQRSCGCHTVSSYVNRHSWRVGWQTGDDDDWCVLILAHFLVPVIKWAAVFCSMVTWLPVDKTWRSKPCAHIEVSSPVQAGGPSHLYK